LTLSNISFIAVLAYNKNYGLNLSDGTFSKFLSISSSTLLKFT